MRGWMGKFPARAVIQLAALLLAISTSEALASLRLSPGGAITLLGTTAATESDLAGDVLRDNLSDFAIKDASGTLVFQGKLQNRVVRSRATGRLHFYYRVRDTMPGLPGVIARITTCCFGSDPVAVDYRTDGLGTVSWTSAKRPAAQPQEVLLYFGLPGLPAGAESRFVHIKTGATGFAADGKTQILGRLSTSESATIFETLSPAP